MVGTSSVSVTRCTEMASSTAFGSNPGTMTWVTPTSAPPKPPAWSAAWNIGAACR